MSNFLPVFVALLVCNASGENTTFARTVRWTNYKSILSTGWFVWDRNLVNRWNSPGDMSSSLSGLNSNFTDEIWGWKARSSTYNVLMLETGFLPEYCGMVNATINVKYYFSGNETNNFIYPALSSNGTHYLEPIPVVEWQYAYVDLDVIAMGIAGPTIGFYVQPGELFLIDEISLTFSVERSEETCPDSCNQDCQYRAIDCFNYYSCSERGHKVYYSCNENQGLAFNPSTGTCDIIENVEGCDMEPVQAIKSQRSNARVISILEQNVCGCGYKPHETNCSSYYYCNDTGNPEGCEQRLCPPGLMWDADSLNDGSGTQQCVLSENAKCRN